MNPTFTAHLEEDLDRIAEGQVPWLSMMQEFYGPFAQELKDAKDQMEFVKRLPTGIACPKCRARAPDPLGPNRGVPGVLGLPGVRLYHRHPAGCPGDSASGPAGRRRFGPAGGHLEAGGKARPHRPYLPRLQQGPGSAPGADVANFWGAPAIPSAASPGTWPGSPEGKPVLAEPGAQPGGAPCPQEGCDGTLVQRRSRRGVFFGCSRYPKCSFTLNQPPWETPCPQWNLPLAQEKRAKNSCAPKKPATTKKLRRRCGA